MTRYLQVRQGQAGLPEYFLRKYLLLRRAKGCVH